MQLFVICFPRAIVNKLNASAGNRTRVTSMATMYSTTRPLMPMSSALADRVAAVQPDAILFHLQTMISNPQGVGACLDVAIPATSHDVGIVVYRNRIEPRRTQYKPFGA